MLTDGEVPDTSVNRDPRPSERALAEAQARDAKLREVLHALLSVHPGKFAPPDTQTCPHDHGTLLRRCGFCDDEAVQNARDALALLAARSALDALLAEARREGAQACVEAAREAAFGEAPRDATLLCPTRPPRMCRTCEDAAAQPVVNAVERAAEVGAKEKP